MTLSLVIPVYVMLLQCTGVGGFGWPIYSRVNIMILPSLQFRNKAPNSASDADATTNLRILHITSREPFSTIGQFDIDLLHRKNWPVTQLHACVSERYDVSEWMFSTMYNE